MSRVDGCPLPGKLISPGDTDNPLITCGLTVTPVISIDHLGDMLPW